MTLFLKNMCGLLKKKWPLFSKPHKAFNSFTLLFICEWPVFHISTVQLFFFKISLLKNKPVDFTSITNFELEYLKISQFVSENTFYLKLKYLISAYHHLTLQAKKIHDILSILVKWNMIFLLVRGIFGKWTVQGKFSLLTQN